MRKRALLIVTLLLGVSMLVASPIGAAPPEDEDVLRIATYEYLENVDPQLHHHRSNFSQLPNVQEPLVIRDQDGTIQPVLATSWEVIDPTTWEFKLREGVTFHNGEPFNAESVKFTLERFIDPDVGSPMGYLWTLLDSVEIVDDYTVHVKTKEPFGALLPTMTLAYMMPPKAGAEEDYPTKGYGTGPYKIVDYERQKGLFLEANPDYWGPQPKVSRIEFIPLTEPATRVAALRAGDVDIVQNVPPEDAEVLESEGFEVALVPGNDTLNLAVGRGPAKQDVAPWNDPKFVEALTFAVDREAIVDAIFEGVGASAATSQLSPTIFGYYGQPVMQMDLDRAQAALAEAGIEPGFKANFVIPKGARPKSVEAGEAIAGMLSQIGLDVQVIPTEPAAAWPILDSSDFDLFLDGWGTMTLDGDINLYTNFHSSTNREGFSDPKIDELVEIGRASTEDDVRLDAYKQVQEMLWDGVSRRIPLYHLTDIYAFSPDIKGWEPRKDQILLMGSAYIEE